MLAGERFSDRPRSVSPVIAAFLRGYNDLVDDARRQDLIRFASDAVGTSGPEPLERARAKRLVEWANERCGPRSLPSVVGSCGARWARRLAATDPDSAAIYAVRSIHTSSRRFHDEVLVLLDELIGMGGRAQVGRRERAGVFDQGSRSMAAIT